MESAQTFRMLAERISAIVYVEAVDDGDEPARELLYVSPRVEDVLGYPPEVWLANPRLREESLHADDRERVLAERARVWKTAEPLDIEYRILARDGRVVWVRDEAAPVRDEAGGPPHWQGAQYDVTARKLAEEENNLLRTIALEIGEAEDLDSALGVALRRVCEATGWAIGQAWLPNGDQTKLGCSRAWYAETDGLDGFRAANEGLVLEPGVGLPGRA